MVPVNGSPTTKSNCESDFAIRRKGSSRESGAAGSRSFPEIFFIAKNCDSESVCSDFHPARRLGGMHVDGAAHISETQDTVAAQPLPEILTIVDVGFSRVIRIACSAHRCIVAKRAAVAPMSLRQHFLKRDTVFFNVLVYSD